MSTLCQKIQVNPANQVMPATPVAVAEAAVVAEAAAIPKKPSVDKPSKPSEAVSYQCPQTLWKSKDGEKAVVTFDKKALKRSQNS